MRRAVLRALGSYCYAYWAPVAILCLCTFSRVFFSDQILNIPLISVFFSPHGAQAFFVACVLEKLADLRHLQRRSEQVEYRKASLTNPDYRRCES